MYYELLWVQRTPDILALRKFGALLYVFYSQTTFDTIVSMCKFGAVTTFVAEITVSYGMFIYENILL